MTITTTDVRVAYNGNGVTTAFSVPFAFFGTGATAELEVIERVISTGAETTKAVTTDYTVSGGSGSTGTVTAVSAPASTVQWIIRRETTRTQAIDYTANDPFPAETHETALDRALAVSQEIEETVSRAMRFPPTDSSSLSPVLPSSVDRASKLLGFDSDGEPSVFAAATLGEIVVSGFMETALAAADSDAAAAALGVGGLTTVNTFTEMQQWSLGTAIDDDDIDGSNILTLPTDGNVFAFTGTQQVDGIATAGVGTEVEFHCGSARTFTHHATNLILPGGVDLVTEDGDVLTFREYATADWRCTNVVRDRGQDMQQGKHTIYLPAGAWRPTVTAGCATIASRETTALRPDINWLLFDASSDEHAQIAIQMPESWDGGTLTFKVVWSTTATDADGVAWGLMAVAVGDGSTFDVGFGTPVVVTDDAQTAAEDCLITAESSALTVAGNPAGGTVVCFDVFRDVSDANDDMTEDAGLVGVTIFYTVNTGNDA